MKPQMHWINYLSRYDIFPILIPNHLNDIQGFMDTINLSGLIISGGDSVIDTPQNPKQSIYHKRDITESIILEHGLKSGVPILGTCRGLQMINKFFEGNTTYGISMSHNHPVAQKHSIYILENPIIPSFSNSQVSVNSYHDDGIHIQDLSIHLTPFAIWENTFVEGFYHPTLPILGVQWHPERTPTSHALDEGILNYWVDLCNS